MAINFKMSYIHALLLSETITSLRKRMRNFLKSLHSIVLCWQPATYQHRSPVKLHVKNKKNYRHVMFLVS